MGKVKRMLEKEVETRMQEYNVRVFWGQDMEAYLEHKDPTQASCLIAHVVEDGSIQWDHEGLRLIACPNASAAKPKILAASRRFR
eukprot:10572977-Karenia_brevis.AAC.1